MQPTIIAGFKIRGLVWEVRFIPAPTTVSDLSMSNLERTLPALPDERGHPTDTTLTQIQQYPFPKQFRVGWSYVSPLITSGQLKAHLALLRAFYALRAKAEDTKFPQVPPHPSHTLKSRRWAFLVAYAVERCDTPPT
jgi:hypothetical protein